MGKVIEYGLEEAAERLDAARLLLQNKKYEDAASRAYYSMFHSTRTLLYTRKVSPKTHRGLIKKFGKEFIKTGEIPREYAAILSNAEALRESADYGMKPEISSKDAKAVVEDAERFLKMAKEFLSKGEL